MRKYLVKLFLSQSKKFFICVLTSILIFHFQSLNAQTSFLDFNKKDFGLSQRLIDEEDGLPTVVVNKILYSKDEFFWLATNEGLIKYDGVKSEFFNKDTKSDFPYTYITNIMLDSNGIIWAGNNLNNLFFIKDDEILKYYQSNIDAVIGLLYSDSKGNKFAGTLKKGLFRIGENELKKIKINANLTNESILSITERKEINQVFVGTQEGLFVLDKNELNPVKNLKLPSNWIRSLLVDSKQRLWVGTNMGVAVFKDSARIIPDLFNDLNNLLITNFYEDYDGNIWIKTYNKGIYIFNENNKKLIHFDYLNKILSNRIISIFFVNNGVMISDVNGGISFFRPKLLNTISADNGLIDEYVQCIYEDKPSEFLVGTVKGLYKIKKNVNNYIVKKLSLLENEHIFFIKRDKQNNLLIGTRTKGLVIYNKGIKRRYDARNSFSVSYIRNVFVDDDNTYWVGTNGGGVYIIKDNHIKNLNSKSGLSNDFISFINKTKDGKYLIGTSGGGLNFIQNEKVVKVLDTSSGLPSNVISSFFEELDGTLWLTAPEGGIVRIKDNSIHKILLTDGLPTDIIFNLILDKNNFFWFTSKRGIFKIKKDELENFITRNTNKINPQIFTTSEGMLTERCVGASIQTVCKSNSDFIFVSTYKGLVVINPEIEEYYSDKIKLYIKNVYVNGSKIKKLEGKIGPGLNRLEINYSAKTLINQKNIKYQYKLHPINSDFNYSFSYLPLVFDDLKPNEYELILVGFDISKSKTDTLKYKFSVLPFFYETTEFKAVLVFIFLLIFGSVIVLAVQLKYSKRIKKLEEINQIEKERMRISRDMHDELGIYATRLSLLSEIIKRNRSDKSLLIKYLNDISTTSNELALSMDEIVWTVNPQNDKLDKLIFYLVQFFENMFSITEITYKVEIPDDIPDIDVKAEIRHNTFLVIKEIVNNILKHSKATEVTLKIKLDNRKLIVEVKDNGVGFNESDILEFSHGIENVKKRMKQINGVINFQTANNKGTKFLLEVNL